MLRRVPRGYAGEAVAVAAAYVITAGYLVTRALDVRSYIWLIDEFLYTKGALGFAGGTLTGHVFSEPTSVHAPLYSWLLAPIYGFLGSANAFKAAHAVDALVFAAVLVPVYLTARYIGARPLIALLVGLLSTWIPYAAATLVLMSESLCYFAFAWAVWAMVRAIAEPSIGRHAIALVFVAATAYTRPQFALLFPAFALAVVVCEVRLVDDAAPFRERIRRHAPLGAAALLGLLLVAVAGDSLLGGYSHTAGMPRFPPGLWQNMLSHAGHIVVAGGILPAVVWLGWLLRSSGRTLDRRLLAFAVLSGVLAALVIYQVGFFSQNVVGGRIQERTAFYVVPLFALGIAAVSVDLRPPAPRLSFLVAAVAVALVIGAVSFAPDEAAGAFEAIANPGASFNADLRDVLGDARPLAETLAIITIVLGALATAVTQPRWRSVGIPALATLALLFTVVETVTLLPRDARGINTAIPAALGSPDPPKAWVDGALFSAGADAGAVEGPLPGADASTVWLWVEFWNKSVNRIYVPPGGRAFSDLPTLPFDLDKATGTIRTPLEKQYLVMSANEARFALRGTVHRRGPFGLVLFKPERPYRAAWAKVGDRIAVFRPEGEPPATEITLSIELSGKTRRVTIDAGESRTLIPAKAGA